MGQSMGQRMDQMKFVEDSLQRFWSDMVSLSTSNFLKAVFHKFYLVHSWILTLSYMHHWYCNINELWKPEWEMEIIWFSKIFLFIIQQVFLKKVEDKNIFEILWGCFLRFWENIQKAYCEKLKWSIKRFNTFHVPIYPKVKLM